MHTQERQPPQVNGRELPHGAAALIEGIDPLAHGWARLEPDLGIWWREHETGTYALLWGAQTYSLVRCVWRKGSLLFADDDPYFIGVAPELLPGVCRDLDAFLMEELL